ncbi:MAG: xylulokinase [Clostridiales Family XIII bacterium]|jgi:xylulokinase|nr:xylulokinase [Clostridiales Family XIII bacterium]
MKTILGIDIGTSGTKTILTDENGRVLASYTEEYPMYQPHNGWAEQNPEDWFLAVKTGIKAVITAAKRENANVSAPIAIGMSGQMHGLVMTDKDGEVLRPSIIWCDQRTEAEIEDMDRIVGRQKIIEITANAPMTGFTAAKILWVRKNEPEIYEKCAHILLPKDYIRYKLTGEYATEVSDASGMQLMDVSSRTWSDELLGLLNIDKNLLANIYESPDVTGKILPSLAAETGADADAIVVGGAADNAAAAIGTGVFSEGTAFTTIGSSAVIYAVSDEVRIDLKGRVHSLCASVPGKWTVMSCTQGAGLSLKWLRDTICTEEKRLEAETGRDAYDIMSELALKIPEGSDRLLFLPYLMGERSPHPDPDARGVFFGLSAIHTRANMIRSVMEGVAFSQLECLNVFREMGVSVGNMVITGGGGKSPFWRQMLADLYECPVHTLAHDEGAAMGAAILASIGAGIFKDASEACENIVQIGSTLEPIEGHTKAYKPYFELYSELYQTLTGEFKKLSAL